MPLWPPGENTAPELFILVSSHSDCGFSWLRNALTCSVLAIINNQTLFIDGGEVRYLEDNNTISAYASMFYLMSV